MMAVVKEESAKYKRRKSAYFKNATDESRYKKLIDQLPLLPITDDETNEKALEILGSVGDRLESGKATNAETGYYKVLLSLVREYETQYRIEKLDSRELVRAIMEFKNLKQEDLAKEFGGQARVSQFLNGKRDLSINQIRSLSKRFKLNESAFLR